ncbi:MAG: hypothetical protein P1V51_13800 [Deltaproteobacteria bacterium]|nr:hypothetical protein [Deltaproteobacteria bacterium]
MKSMFRLLPIFLLALSLTACGGKDDDDAVCGNGTCEAGEDASSCSADCAESCGNGTCDAGETSATCSADCPVCNNNGTCNAGENSDNCPNDCPVTCNNNGTCDAGETSTSCAADCPVVCNNNGTCDAGETPANCAADCNTTCGNGVCDAGETNTNCAADCPITCGNGTCDPGETITGCPADCTDVCALVATGQNIGAECGNQTQGFCGADNAGVCASFDQATPATCFQTCVPNACETTCTGDQRCLGVLDSNGNAIELQPGYNLGVCDTPATGDQGAFAECGGTAGNCQAGLDCLSFGSGQPGICMPGCTPATEATDCPTVESMTSQCVITTATGADPTYCAIVCPLATPTCPTGLTCTNVGDPNNGICM